MKNYTFFPVRKILGIVNQGNGILTRHKIINNQNIKLETNGENRFLSISTITVQDKPIHIFTTHLALGHISRVKELKHIARIVNETEGAIILTGDLNTHNEKELEILLETRLRRVETGGTFPSWNPKERLDYIFYSNDFELIETKVASEIKQSDHLPVVAELRIKNSS